MLAYVLRYSIAVFFMTAHFSAHAEGLSTLSQVAKNQDSMLGETQKETKAFNAVKKGLENGTLTKGQTQDIIRSRFGEPVVTLTNSDGNEKWIYKPAHASYFNGIKIYLFFNTEKTLAGIKMLNSGK